MIVFWVIFAVLFFIVSILSICSIALHKKTIREKHNEVKKLRSELQRCTVNPSGGTGTQYNAAQHLSERIKQLEEINSIQSDNLQQAEAKKREYQVQLSELKKAKAESDDAFQRIHERISVMQQDNAKMQQQEHTSQIQNLTNQLKEMEKINHDQENEVSKLRSELQICMEKLSASENSQKQEHTLLMKVQSLQNQLQDQIAVSEQYSIEIQELKNKIQIYNAELKMKHEMKSAYADLQQKYQALVKERDLRNSQKKSIEEIPSAAVQPQNEGRDDRYSEYCRTICTDTRALSEIASVEFLLVNVALSGDLMLSPASNYRSAQVIFLASSGELLPNPYFFSHFTSNGETMQNLSQLAPVFEIRPQLSPECRYMMKKIVPAKCHCTASEYTLLEKGRIWFEEM